MVRWFTMRLAVFAAMLGSASVLAAVACSSSRSEPGPTADAGPDGSVDAADAADGAAALPFPLDQVCTPSTETDVCGKCARDHCCITRTRILGTDAGNALVDCFKAPSCNTACETACFDSAPAETAPFLEHLGCLTHYCPVECGDAPAGGCSVCMERQCARESLSCSLSRDCFLLSSCVAACGKVEACVNDCNAKYPKGTAASSALAVCATNLCERECSQ